MCVALPVANNICSGSMSILLAALGPDRGLVALASNPTARRLGPSAFNQHSRHPRPRFANT